MTAAPPDEGHLGANTTPEDVVPMPNGDTRSSETIGKTAPKAVQPNRGLLLFWLTIALACGLMAMFRLLRG